MNSTLYLIKNTPILIDRNFKVPSFDHIRRSSVGGYSIVEDFMYVKHNLDLTIKIESNQTGLEYKDENNINYIIIKNNTIEPKEVGYFVTRKRWISEKTIEFTLHCDTINSFIDDIELSDRTKILRQHKDRFIRNVGEPSRIGDIEIIPQSSFDISEECTLIYNESDVLEHTYLYNLSKTFPFYITMAFSVDDDASLCKYYFVDENYKIISEIPYQIDVRAFRIAYGNNGLPRELVVNGSSVSIPSNAKYIAMRHVPHSINSASFYIQVYDWEDLTDKEIEEINEYMHSYVYELVDKKGNFIEATTGDDKLVPIIDFYSEGLHPILYGEEKGKIQERKQYLRQSWYLMYKNQNEPTDSLVNPVECYLIPEKMTNYAAVASWTGEYTARQLNDFIRGYEKQSGTVVDGIVIPAKENNGLTIQFNGNTYTIPAGDDFGCIWIEILGSTNEDRWVNVTILRSDTTTGEIIHEYDSEEVAPNSLIKFTNAVVARYGAYSEDYYVFRHYPIAHIFATTSGYNVSKTIYQIDRTDAKIIKIIKLPYSPTDIKQNVYGYTIYDNSYWSYDASTKLLKLKDFSSRFTRTMSEITAFYPYSPLDYIPMPEIDGTELKDINLEYKLYHSDYYQPKFVYDSFGFVFQLENITERKENYNTTEIQFSVTSTINSRFMFAFPDYKCSKRQNEDYNNICIVARNNEVPIFNQQYINYLRTGYNYDVKSKQRQKEASLLGAGLSLVGAIASFASSAYTGALGITAGIALASSSVMQIVNTANTIAQNEENLQAKQVQLQNEATSVYGSDDVDMLTEYSGNRAKMMLYQVSPKLKKALFDLFYYTGYICEEIGLPNTTSRMWFNFVSADVIFKKVPNIPDDIVDEIKARYLGGITFLHSNKGVIDYEQKYENWEVSILDE